ncbi:MAG: chemotaxis protein CheW [Betaproteobacteria bacterium]|nr:chemotaxis protein CheW [Betaproteobacteria bacterium]
MARKTSLREFQQAVAQRLRDLSASRSLASKLGFQVGSQNWLVSLTDVSEVIPVPAIMPVPMTEAWFRGVANVRGKLYAISDLSRFQGGADTPPGIERRVILSAERIIEGSGLLVSRMLGLRNPDQFTAEPLEEDDAHRPWIRARLRDAAGTLWLDMDLTKLAASQRFLEVGVYAQKEGATAARAS